MAVITPDPVAVLADFARRNAIRYPLLSDVGGVIVEKYAILNPNIPRDHPKQAVGLPFPGHFLLTPDGSVRGKAFTGDLRHRPSGTLLAFEHFGAGGPPHVSVDIGNVCADISLSTRRLFHGQEVGVLARIRVAAGWHVYASEVQRPYTPISIEFQTEDHSVLRAQQIDVPRGRLLEFPAIGETLPVLGEQFDMRGRLRLRWSPPPSLFPEMAEAVRRRAVSSGEHLLQGVFRFQACSDNACLQPVAATFSIPITVEDHVTARAAEGE
jgi:hypothetical protein